MAFFRQLPYPMKKIRVNMKKVIKIDYLIKYREKIENNSNSIVKFLEFLL